KYEAFRRLTLLRSSASRTRGQPSPLFDFDLITDLSRVHSFQKKYSNVFSIPKSGGIRGIAAGRRGSIIGDRSMAILGLGFKGNGRSTCRIICTFANTRPVPEARSFSNGLADSRSEKKGLLTWLPK